MPVTPAALPRTAGTDDLNSPRPVENLDGVRFRHEAGLTRTYSDAAKLGITLIGEFPTIPQPNRRAGLSNVGIADGRAVRRLLEAHGVGRAMTAVATMNAWSAQALLR